MTSCLSCDGSGVLVTDWTPDLGGTEWECPNCSTARELGPEPEEEEA